MPVEPASEAEYSLGVSSVPKSEIIGGGTSAVEVLNVSPHGFWPWVAGREHFLGFERFPWFRKAAVSQLFAVELH